MVLSYLLDWFGISADVVDIRWHAPEDFVVRFRHRVDRDRVLAAPLTGLFLPLVWRPWRRTSQVVSGNFKFRVIVALSHVPLHARNAVVAQTILGPCCAEVVVLDRADELRDVPEDDDREMFVTAWCFHPHFLRPQQLVFIPEPHIHGVNGDDRLALPGLQYLIRIHLVAYQDWSTPPPSDGEGGAGDDSWHGDEGGADDHGDQSGLDDIGPPTDYNSSQHNEGDGSWGAECGHAGSRCHQTETPAIVVGDIVCAVRP